jgi:predicted PurR-regulated permease PerM
MKSPLVRHISIFAIAVILLALMWVLRSALYPFIAALVIAYLLDPLVMSCQRILKIQRLPALLLVFALFLLVFALIFISLFPLLIKGVSSLTETLSTDRETINAVVNDLIIWFRDIPLPIDHEKIISGLYSDVKGFFEQFFGGISAFAISAIESVPLLIIIPLIVFYLLKDKVAIFASLKRFFSEESEASARALFESVNWRLGGYIKGQFLISLLVTIITYIALLIFDMPYALLIAIANGVLNIIPYFGPVIGAIPPVILALIPFTSLGYFLAVLIFFVVMNILVTTLASPKIFAKTTNLHPIMVLLALYIGSDVMGMLGLIVAVPLALIFQTLFRIIFDKYIWEI